MRLSRTQTSRKMLERAKNVRIGTFSVYPKTFCEVSYEVDLKYFVVLFMYLLSIRIIITTLYLEQMWNTFVAYCTFGIIFHFHKSNFIGMTN